MDSNIDKSKLSVEQMRAAQQTAHNIKFGSPKLRDILRQKCRIRIKESRCKSFEQFRRKSKEALLESVIEEELKEMELDIALQDKIYKEMLEEKWLADFMNAESLDVVLFDYDDDDDYGEPVKFCPICQKDRLLEMKTDILCPSCKIKFYSGQCSLEQFHKLIVNKTVEHEYICCDPLIYFVEPIDGTDKLKLNALCDTCNYLREFP